MNIDKKDFHKKKKFWWVVKDSHNYKQVHVNKKKLVKNSSPQKG